MKHIPLIPSLIQPLTHLPLEAPNRGSNIIERVAGGRKLRHDQAVSDLHDELSVISKVWFGC